MFTCTFDGHAVIIYFHFVLSVGTASEVKQFVLTPRDSICDEARSIVVLAMWLAPRGRRTRGDGNGRRKVRAVTAWARVRECTFGGVLPWCHECPRSLRALSLGFAEWSVPTYALSPAFQSGKFQRELDATLGMEKEDDDFHTKETHC